MNLKSRIVCLFLLGIFTGHCRAQINDFKTVDFSKADSVAMACFNLKLHNLPLLSHRLTSDLNTDVEKFRAIYMWVCSNIKNDHSLFLKNKRKRKRFKDDSLKLRSWNKTLKPILFKKLKNNKRTICSGYSYLIKTLSTLSGLECKFISGYGRTSMTTIEDLEAPNHSWNAVKLNGRWYLCDATWASGLGRSADKGFREYEGYFLSEPLLFSQNHLPKHNQWLLLPNTQIQVEQFLESPIFYSKAFNYIESAATPNRFTNKLLIDEPFLFQYRLQTPIHAKNIKLLIVNGENKTIVSPTSLIKNGNDISFKQQFHRAGEFDVHLLIDTTLIASYSFIVNKTKMETDFK